MMKVAWRDRLTAADVLHRPRHPNGAADIRPFAVCAPALVTLQIVLAWSHIAWLDEWQALMIAVQSPTLSALLENLRYEGHPPLWYLLLRAAASVLSPHAALVSVQIVIAVAIQALILTRSPFGYLDRLLIGSSFFILFDVGAISRSLSLGVLLLLCACATPRPAWKWLAIAMLPLVDFLFGVLSIAMLVLFWRSDHWSWRGFALWLLCSVIAAVTVRPAADMIPALRAEGVAGLWPLLVNLSALLIPLHTVDGHLEWTGGLPAPWWIFAGPAFLAFGILVTARNRLHQCIFLGVSGVLIAFSLLVYPLAIRHLSLLALLLIILKWRELDRGARVEPIFRAWLLVASFFGLATAALSFTRPFDSAPQVADVMERRGLSDAHWVAFPDSRGESVAGLLGREFATLGKNCTQSFIRWNFRDGITTERQLEAALQKHADRHGRFYLLTDWMLDGIDDGFVRLIADIPAGYDGQHYRLFVVAPTRPAISTPGPCPPARLPLPKSSLRTAPFR